MFFRSALVKHTNYVKFSIKRYVVHTIDRSKVPTLNDNDLEEQFIKGSGPGGQKVNKSNNCVYLKHKPTGLSVKVHECRDQSMNRKKAREKLITMLDNQINGENSVENQEKRILEEKSKRKQNRQNKVLEMKRKWRESFTACQ